jgi:hypothetical protein
MKRKTLFSEILVDIAVEPMYDNLAIVTSCSSIVNIIQVRKDSQTIGAHFVIGHLIYAS